MVSVASEAFAIPETTLHDQRRAADPRASAWVSANAGAGKTKVLTDRVVRLLLAGTPPGRILCLTFTKAAAANMAIRIFERLGRWVTQDDASLARELADLEGEPPTPERLRAARTLFARSVETPGGLKIDTIHAFCERILHLVPFEANVPARFAVLDESQSAELLAEATASVLAAATSGEDPALAEALDLLSAEAAGDALRSAIEQAVRHRAAARGFGPSALDRLRLALGLGPDETTAAIEAAMIEGGLGPDAWDGIAERLAASKNKTDRDVAASFRAALAATHPAERLAHLLSVYFTGKGEPRDGSRWLTKAVDPALKERLVEEQGRLVLLQDRLKAARAFERTRALFTFAEAIHAQVAATKARLGALDFHDLIARTLALLTRGDAAWVLYKLDRGIDHVLVDEAQDTNPEQWEILRLITADFTAGHGAKGRRIRTLFAVGDPKQSIYGFQGAAPQEFEATRLTWSRKVVAAELAFEDVRLTLSFRSARAVLSAVDATFAIERHYRGLSFEGGGVVGTVHESARPHAPGLVELWPTEVPAEAEEPEAWTLPLDEPEASAPPVVVARRIAGAVKTWIRHGDETGQRRRAGDVLVLMRRRGPAFAAVIRALKEAGVPVAGADRLDIGEHIAVLDLVAAGRAALLPDDDLTLASALKSPLVGLTDDDLVRLAATRAEEESVADALRRHAEAGDAVAARAVAALDAWQDLARRHGPFGFYATVLGPMAGRAKLVGRLGSEAGDAIDAFLCVAHGAERVETPSLTAFLARFESAAHDIKRDLDSSRDEVRVMTVHGAKGLEAPVVVLVDGCEVLGRDPPLVPLRAGDGALPVWSPGRSHDCGAVALARDALQARGLEEHNRLLYVAMTRARDRLVIAPYRTARRESPEAAWCEMIRRGLLAKAGGLVRNEAPYGPVEVWRDGVAWPSPGPAPVEAPEPAIDAPAWLKAPAPTEARPLPALRPSAALPAPAGHGGDGAFARLRGLLVHTLLERLPALSPDRREAAARAYVAARAPRLSLAERDRIVADAFAVMTDERLAPLFGEAARAEAAIVGEVPLGGARVPVSGRIDRLAVVDGTVFLADFKTGHRPPAGGGLAHLAQIALYRTLLADIYPDAAIRCFLVWTHGPAVQELASDALAAALAQLDAEAPAAAGGPS